MIPVSSWAVTTSLNANVSPCQVRNSKYLADISLLFCTSLPRDRDNLTLSAYTDASTGVFIHHRGL